VNDLAVTATLSELESHTASDRALMLVTISHPRLRLQRCDVHVYSCCVAGPILISRRRAYTVNKGNF